MCVEGTGSEIWADVSRQLVREESYVYLRKMLKNKDFMVFFWSILGISDTKILHHIN